MKLNPSAKKKYKEVKTSRRHPCKLTTLEEFSDKDSSLYRQQHAPPSPPLGGINFGPALRDMDFRFFSNCKGIYFYSEPNND